MKTLQVLFIIALVSAVAVSQPLVQGPKSGSVPGGVTVTTGTIPVAGNPKSYPPIFGRPYLFDPVPDAAGTAPSGETPGMVSVEDHSTTLDDPITKPLILEDFAGIPDEGIISPADPTVAVGPNHVMACVRNRFCILDKSGNVLKTIDAADWFADFLPDQYVMYQPKVRYDHYADRWLMVWLIDDGTWTVWGDTSYFLISVSDDASPLGTWYNWAVPSHTVGDSAAGNIADYEGVGFDEEALYITSNQHNPPSGTFEYVKVRIFGKSQFYNNDAGPITWTDFWDVRDPDDLGVRVIQLMPMLTWGSPGQYFLISSARNSPGSDYNLFKIFSPLSSPAITASGILSSPYRHPPNAVQPGGIPVNIGWRLRSEAAVAYRDSNLYVVHHVASGPGDAYSAIRYLRFNPFTDNLLEEVDYGQDGYWYYYPALMVDQGLNVGITFNRSSASEHIGTFVTGRREADPPGLSQSVVLKAGEASFVRHDSLGVNRWGTYNGIALDPSDENAIWTFTAYAASPANTWGTFLARMKVMRGAPALVAPPDGAILQPTTLSLKWSPAEGSGLYHLQVATDPAFTAIVHQDSTHGGFTQQVGPLDTVTHYWRVRGINGRGPGVWSPVWSFTSVAERGMDVAVDEGWNLISVPVTVEDYTAREVFPESGPVAWHYYSGYHLQPTLVQGEGYWMKFESAGSYTVTGLPVLAETVDVAKGWNTIGSISRPVLTASIGSIPGGIMTTSFFCYLGDAGYEPEDTINPGCAAWVKVSQDGQLILSAGVAIPPANRIRIERTDELPPPPPGSDGAVAEQVVPARYRLEQNYPNPFNPVTTIRYALPEGGHVKLSVFNLLGQEVRVLVDGIQEPGYREVAFDAGTLPSGVYTCRITTGTFTDEKKMLLLK